MRTENVWYAVIKFNIHTLNIPQAYLQKMYDCFVRRTAEEDCCIVLHEKDTLGEIDLFARDIVSEYETKAAMYMLAVQSRIQSLLVAIARKSEKINVQKRGNTQIPGYRFIIFWSISICIHQIPWKYRSWQRCVI